VAEARRTAPALLLKEPSQALGATQSQLNTLMSKIRTSKQEVLATRQNQEAERADRAIFENALKAVVERTNAAEDMVEKAVITYAQVEQTEDKDEAMQVVADTEKAAMEAQKAISESLGIMASRLGSSVKQMKTESIRKEVSAKMEELRGKLRDANKKLTPLKAVKQEFAQKQAALIAAHEIYEKLAPAEVEVDRAEELCAAKLSTPDIQDDVLLAVEKAVSDASNLVGVASRLLELKLRGGQGVMKTELGKVEERVKKSHGRIEVMRSSLKNLQETRASKVLLEAVKEKMDELQEALNQAGASKQVWMSAATKPPAEVLEAVKDGEPAIAAANKAVVKARMVLSMKLIELKRYSEERSQDMKGHLQRYQQRLDAAVEEVAEMKKSFADIKRTAEAQQLEAQITGIEEVLEKAKAAGAVYEDEANLQDKPREEVREAARVLKLAESAAKTEIGEVQKVVTQRLVEARAAEKNDAASEEFMKLQTRLRKLQLDSAKYKKMPPAAEKAIVVQKLLDAALLKVCSAETEVKSATDLTVQFAEAVQGTLEDRQGLEAQREAVEAALAAAWVSTKTVRTHLGVHKNSAAADQEEVKRLDEQIGACQETLEKSSTTARDAVESLTARLGIQEAGQKVQDAEHSLEKAVEAVKNLNAASSKEKKDDAGEDMEIVSELDATLAYTRKVAVAAKTFLITRKVAAKRLGEKVQESTLASLEAMVARVEQVSSKSAELFKSSAELKYKIARAAVDARFADIKSKVADAKEASRVLQQDSSEDRDASSMQGDLQQAGLMQKLANEAAQELSTLLQELIKDAPAGKASEEVDGLKKVAEDLAATEKEMDQEVKYLQGFEQKFVAGHVTKRADDLIEKCQEKLMKAESIAEPMVGGQDFQASLCVSYVASQLTERAAEQAETMEQVVAAIARDDGKITAEEFNSTVSSFPNYTKDASRCFTEQELKSAFRLLDSKGGGEVTVEEMMEHCKVHYTCVARVSITDTLAVSQSNTVRMLEESETVEGLGAAGRDEGSGLLRLRVRCMKDGAEGYVSMRGNQEGAAFLQLMPPFLVVLRQVEQAMQEVASSIAETAQFLKAQLEEIKGATSGPLLAAKQHIAKLRVQVTKNTQVHSKLKASVSEAKRLYDKVSRERVELRKRVLSRKLAEIAKEEK